jgi:group I intron endonuclease
MENKIYGVIYKITNLINRKVYIGQTKQKLRQRWSGHKYCSKNNTNNMNISKAIKKYGPENFTIEKIDEADSFESLNLLEEYYIKEYNSCDKKFGYNIDKIHNGVKYRSTRIKNKMSKLNKSKKRREISSNNGLLTRGKKRNGNFVGVNKTKNGTYSSVIGYNNKLIYLGTYNKESDAAKAYDIKAIDLYGKDCLLNFPELRISYINKEI